MNNSGLGYALAAEKIREERMKNPIIDSRQKFTVDTEVYVRPMYESFHYHFQCDVISVVEGTYAQMYWGEKFNDYCLEIGAWYDEGVLMPTEGMSLDQCREKCLEYFGEPYTDLKQKRDDQFKTEFDRTLLITGLKDLLEKNKDKENETDII